MIDHISSPVSNLAASTAFYRMVLGELGDFKDYPDGNAVGSGAGRWSFGGFASRQTIEPFHIAFEAPDAQAVARFHAAALNAGASDNGAPGPRPAFGRGCFAAFVLDPDGHSIETVFRGNAEDSEPT